jgi:hypothetical protein
MNAMTESQNMSFYLEALLPRLTLRRAMGTEHPSRGFSSVEYNPRQICIVVAILAANETPKGPLSGSLVLVGSGDLKCADIIFGCELENGNTVLARDQSRKKDIETDVFEVIAA